MNWGLEEYHLLREDPYKSIDEEVIQLANGQYLNRRMDYKKVHMILS